MGLQIMKQRRNYMSRPYPMKIIPMCEKLREDKIWSTGIFFNFVTVVTVTAVTEYEIL